MNLLTGASLLALGKSIYYTSKASENELRERIPVPRDKYLQSILSSRACCEGQVGH